MTAETDTEFLDRVFAAYGTLMGKERDRLFALARRGADAAARIQQLEAALRDLLNASERHIFSTECQKERDAARAALGGSDD